MMLESLLRAHKANIIYIPSLLLALAFVGGAARAQEFRASIIGDVAREGLTGFGTLGLASPGLARVILISARITF
ncbi:MAG: hypothetical protein ACRD2B_07730 [Terriglobia bacterium]